MRTSNGSRGSLKNLPRPSQTPSATSSSGWRMTPSCTCRFTTTARTRPTRSLRRLPSHIFKTVMLIAERVPLTNKPQHWLAPTSRRSADVVVAGLRQRTRARLTATVFPPTVQVNVVKRARPRVLTLDSSLADEFQPGPRRRRSAVPGQEAHGRDISEVTEADPRCEAQV